MYQFILIFLLALVVVDYAGPASAEATRFMCRSEEAATSIAEKVVIGDPQADAVARPLMPMRRTFGSFDPIGITFWGIMRRGEPEDEPTPPVKKNDA